MQGLATIGRVLATTKRDGRTSTSTCYYLSSARLSAEALAKAVRTHWTIENGLHCVLDITSDEDRSRTRENHASESISMIRKLAINVLKTVRPEISIRQKRERSRW